MDHVPRMWVSLVPPDGWTVTRSATRRAARAPGGGLVLEWFPMGKLPRRQTEWIMRTMTADLEPGACLDELELSRAETTGGWPVAVAQARVVGGASWARRLGAFYAFFEHGGVALAEARDPVAWAREEAPLRRALLGAAPDAGELVVSVAGFDGSDA